MLERLGPAGEASDVVPGGLEGSQEPATDVAGGARQEDAAEGAHRHAAGPDSVMATLPLDRERPWRASDVAQEHELLRGRVVVDLIPWVGESSPA